MKLASFSKNIYSQFGEDGIISKIFEIMESRSKICVEFGAWDGLHFSNTANLWSNQGWTGVLVEGDENRAAKLKKNIEGYKCTAICRYVGIEDGSTIEDILNVQGVTEEVDLLSIDIDGNDYYVISTLKHIRPRVIICEYNPTIPYWMDSHSLPGSSFGSSVSALVRIAREKGYRLIALTDTNCIFVVENEYPKFKMFDTALESMAINKHLNLIITSYDGKYFVRGGFPYGLSTRSLCGMRIEYDNVWPKENNQLCILKRPFMRSAFKEIARSLLAWIIRSNKSNC